MNKHYIAALYMRLSKDDSTGKESGSILTQRRLLRSFCKKNGYDIYDEYIDDGFSGTSFERPAFKKMLSDIEDGKVNLVAVKDLSRLGREYIQSGHFQEVYFPMKGVRFVAVCDGYDSQLDQCSDIAPIKNIVNELYARDTSRKIRSAFRALMSDGEYVASFAPYGYIKDPENRHRLIPDTETADNIKTIFRLASNGKTPSEIARIMTQKEIETPLDRRKRLKGNPQTQKSAWSPSTVSKILSNKVYLGHTLQGKTTKASFKSDAVIYNPEELWHTVLNTHAPLVSRRLFTRVRKLTSGRLCRGKKGVE